jgi:hypothetical protein
LGIAGVARSVRLGKRTWEYRTCPRRFSRRVTTAGTGVPTWFPLALRVEEPLRFIWVMLDSSGASGQCVDYGLWPLRFTRLLPELPLSTNTPLRSATGTGFEWARLVAGESSLRGSPAGGNGGKAASSSSFERTVSHGVAWSAPGVEGASARPNVRSTSAAARCRALKVSGSDLRFACFFFGVFIPTL